MISHVYHRTSTALTHLMHVVACLRKHCLIITCVCHVCTGPLSVPLRGLMSRNAMCADGISPALHPPRILIICITRQLISKPDQSLPEQKNGRSLTFMAILPGQRPLKGCETSWSHPVSRVIEIDNLLRGPDNRRSDHLTTNFTL